MFPVSPISLMPIMPTSHSNPGMQLVQSLAAFSLMRVTAGILGMAHHPGGSPVFSRPFGPGVLCGFNCIGRPPFPPGCCRPPVGLWPGFPCMPPACPMPQLPGNPGMPECPPEMDPWVVTPECGGRASVDLGDGYTMELNEHSSEIIIRDADGNETRIWGDPHVDVNGERIGDFYDTTTFELENGTKITINTEPWNGNPNAYVASQVVVTRGDRGMVIEGISQNQKGDLSITVNEDGRALDFQHDDGLNLYEEDLGGGDYGWTSEFTGERATRADFDLTRHVNKEKREAMEFNRDFSNALGAWFLFGDFGAMLSFASSESGEREIRDSYQAWLQPQTNVEGS